MRNHLSQEAIAKIERGFEVKREALELIGLVAAEFESDPMSTQCFDLRIVERVKNCAKDARNLLQDGSLLETQND